jgi:hypothetical protein
MMAIMFDEAFEKYNLDNIARILDDLSQDIPPATFDPIETDILYVPLSFYPDYQLLHIKSKNAAAPLQRYVVYKPGDYKILDFTNAPIYELNQTVPIKLMGITVLDYVQFFLKFVKGKMGFFHLIQSVDDINWKEDPPAQARRSIADMITPLTLKTIGKGDQRDTYFCDATVMFKHGLFHCDITVDPKGFVVIDNQELLIEDMPVYSDSVDI